VRHGKGGQGIASEIGAMLGLKAQQAERITCQAKQAFAAAQSGSATTSSNQDSGSVCRTPTTTAITGSSTPTTTGSYLGERFDARLEDIDEFLNQKSVVVVVPPLRVGA
jgi:hypothetical protein